MLSMESESSGQIGARFDLMREENDTLPWVEKYRPKELHELLQSHAPFINIIESLIHSNKFPHILLYGPPGTGKTTTILACARRLFGKRYASMILELNASDDRGIETVREKIKTFCSTKTIFGTMFKLVLLDEADSMTQIAQNALRRIMEKYSDNVRFCFTCNHVGKIIPALQSRCTCFKFPPLSHELIDKCLSNVIAKEGINATECGKKALEKLSEGDMRKALNILQATHVAHNIVNESTVYSCSGSPPPKDIKMVIDWLLTGDFDQVYRDLSDLQVSHGFALSDIVSEVHLAVLELHIPPKMRIHLLKSLAEIESNLSRGSTPAIQLSSLVGSFKIGADIAYNSIKI